MKKDLDLFVPKKAPSHRQSRVAQEIRHCLADVLSRGDFPTLRTSKGKMLSFSHPITITSVDVSPDLHHATISVMPLGGLFQAEALTFLTAFSGLLRKTVSQKVHLRTSPMLAFEIDRSFSVGEKIDSILNSLG
ncbi:MAG: ribosome-binding factor A [Alphaproteobacteria bacterium]|nr:ribosome-binding factor A [Alphaproteobacteria bacterium]